MSSSFTLLVKFYRRPGLTFIPCVRSCRTTFLCAPAAALLSFRARLPKVAPASFYVYLPPLCQFMCAPPSASSSFGICLPAAISFRVCLLPCHRSVSDRCRSESVGVKTSDLHMHTSLYYLYIRSVIIIAGKRWMGP